MTNKEEYYRKVLEQIANSSRFKEDPELDNQNSWGNFDDVFSDGFDQAEYYYASVAREALKVG